MVRISKSLPLAFLALGLVIPMGCTDDTSVQIANNDTQNNRDELPDTPVPANSRLEFAEPCAATDTNCTVNLVVDEDSRRTIAVRLVDGSGAPVANVAVGFQVVTPTEAAGTTVGSANGVTNEDGVAQTTVRAGNDPVSATGLAQVVASVADESVNKLQFTVAVNSKDAASYIINFEHFGSARFNRVEALLFSPDTTCAAIDNEFRQFGRFPTTAEGLRHGTVDADRTIYPIIYPNLQNGATYTVVGAARAPVVGDDGVQVAYQCKEDNPAITHGQSVNVTLTLVDRVPFLMPSYNIEHNFDLTEALPESVRRIIGLVGRIITDPGSFLIGCPASDPSCAGGSEGIVQILADFLPSGSFGDTIRSFADQLASNGMLNSAVRSILNDYLDGLRDRLPNWLNVGIDVTDDMIQTVTNFRVRGVMRFSEQPLPSTHGNEVVGLLPENSGYQVWNEFFFRWSPGCAAEDLSCGVRNIRAEDLVGNDSVIHGNFDGTIFGADQLAIGQHSLDLNYGILVMGIIEKVVFPQIFGPTVTSINALLDELFSCSGLAESITGNTSGTFYNTVNSFCIQLKNEASDQIRNYVSSNLVASGDNTFRIGTPADEHCTIYQPDQYLTDTWQGYPLPKIDALGKVEPDNLRCKWEIQFSEGSVIQPMTGLFNGTAAN